MSERKEYEGSGVPYDASGDEDNKEGVKVDERGRDGTNTMANIEAAVQEAPQAQLVPQADGTYVGPDGTTFLLREDGSYVAVASGGGGPSGLPKPKSKQEQGSEREKPEPYVPKGHDTTYPPQQQEGPQRVLPEMPVTPEPVHKPTPQTETPQGDGLVHENKRRKELERGLKMMQERLASQNEEIQRANEEVHKVNQVAAQLAESLRQELQTLTAMMVSKDEEEEALRARVEDAEVRCVQAEQKLRNSEARLALTRDELEANKHWKEDVERLNVELSVEKEGRQMDSKLFGERTDALHLFKAKYEELYTQIVKVTREADFWRAKSETLDAVCKEMKGAQPERSDTTAEELHAVRLKAQMQESDIRRLNEEVRLWRNRATKLTNRQEEHLQRLQLVAEKLQEEGLLETYRVVMSVAADSNAFKLPTPEEVASQRAKAEKEEGPPLMTLSDRLTLPEIWKACFPAITTGDANRMKNGDSPGNTGVKGATPSQDSVNLMLWTTEIDNMKDLLRKEQEVTRSVKEELEETLAVLNTWRTTAEILTEETEGQKTEIADLRKYAETIGEKAIQAKERAEKMEANIEEKLKSVAEELMQLREDKNHLATQLYDKELDFENLRVILREKEEQILRFKAKVQRLGAVVDVLKQGGDAKPNTTVDDLGLTEEQREAYNLLDEGGMVVSVPEAGNGRGPAPTAGLSRNERSSSLSKRIPPPPPGKPAPSSPRAEFGIRTTPTPKDDDNGAGAIPGKKLSMAPWSRDAEVPSWTRLARPSSKKNMIEPEG